MARALTWTDVREIAERLEAAHPGAEILKLRFTDLHAMVCALDGFTGDPKRANEQILEAIQMAWLEERE